MLNRTINIKGELFSLDRPVVMGILNVTGDRGADRGDTRSRWRLD